MDHKRSCLRPSMTYENMQILVIVSGSIHEHHTLHNSRHCIHHCSWQNTFHDTLKMRVCVMLISCNSLNNTFDSNKYLLQEGRGSEIRSFKYGKKDCFVFLWYHRCKFYSRPQQFAPLHSPAWRGHKGLTFPLRGDCTSEEITGRRSSVLFSC